MCMCIDIAFRTSAVIYIALVFQAACFNVDAFARNYKDSKIEIFLKSGLTNFLLGQVLYLFFLLLAQLLIVFIALLCSDNLHSLSFMVNSDPDLDYHNLSITQFLSQLNHNLNSFLSGKSIGGGLLFTFLLVLFYLAVLVVFYGKSLCHFMIKPIQKYIWKMA